MTPGTDYILDALAREGIDHLFMVPGGLVDPFLPALGRFPAIRPIVAAQEGGAAYMADGYARASGKFGAALAIGGPGVFNMTTAVAAALTDSSRILVLSGEVALAMEGLGMFQDASYETLDDPLVLAPVTRFSTSVDSAENLNHIFRRALMEMAGPPSGPVHLSLPRDVLTGEIAVAHIPIDAALFHEHPLDTGMAERALLPLLGRKGEGPAVRVAILAGAGVEHGEAAPALREAAERFAIPVATTLRAKGVFPEDHPLSLGVFGYAGTRHATAALLNPDLDLLFVLGSGLNERDTMHFSKRLAPSRGMVSVNTSAKSLAQETASGLGVLGDCAAFLDYLLNHAEACPALEAGLDQRKTWHEAIRFGPRLYDTGNLDSKAVPLHPARVVGALRKALPRDGIVLVDSGAHRAFAGHYFDAYAPRTYISATNLGPMGWGIPAAVGVACARPGTRVALITGDGCMQMHGLEIAVAARYRLPITYVVLSNGALGNVWLRAHQLGPVPAELTSIPDHDWAGFARALAVAAATVRQPEEIAPALEAAMANDGPYLIDFKTEKNAPTPVYDFAAEAAHWSYQE